MGAKTRIDGLAVVLVAGALVLGGCAGSTPDPVTMDPLTPEEDIGTYAELIITSETASDVVMTDDDRQRIVGKVKHEIAQRAPGRFTIVQPDRAATVEATNADAPSASLPANILHMHILFNEYDEGNAFARAMLAGLGQIHIGTIVTLWDQKTQQVLAKYEVSKQFAFGGIYGGVTGIEDVEDGLASGIAEVVVPGSARKTESSEPTYPK